MASIRELSSGRYNAQVRRKGLKPLSKTFDTKDDAQRWAERIEGAISEPNSKRERQEPILTFRELGTRYCNSVLRGRPSQQITQRRIERMADHLPEDVRTITKHNVNDYRLMRLEQVASVTCRDELQIIHRVYRWAHQELILDKSEHPSPCTEITMPPASKPRNRVVTRAELELLLTALSPTMRLIVELAYETAMRRSEIVKLTPKRLHLEERYLEVIDGKTGDRLVPLTNRAVTLLRESLSANIGSQARLFPIDPHSVSTAVRRARKAVGLDDDVRLHQLRHSRITEVAKKGFNQAQIMMT